MQKTAALVILAIPLLEPRAAEACGGCFSPPETVTTVDSHRMVVSLSATETILWDQIRYSGSPEDFVWVLPVPSEEARVELGSEDFFVLLEAQSAPVILAPPPPRTFCGQSASVGCGFGGAAADDSPAAADAGTGVEVHREETVGPYETVVISSRETGALQLWLGENGYAVPPAVIPTMEWYANAGNAFVVLRLAPGEDTTAMQPIRVRYPGYMASFPLRMVKVGAAQLLELSLWIIADQRYETANYPTVQIDPSRLAWDWNQGRSRYPELFDQTIDEAGGNAWIVEHASILEGEYWDSWTGATYSAPDDVAAAIANVPGRFVTRLRTRMLLDHLGEDLELRQSANNSFVDRNLTPGLEIDRPADVDCGDDDGGDRGLFCTATIGKKARGVLTGFALLGFAMVALRWRRRR